MSISTNREDDLEWRAEHSDDWRYAPEPWETEPIDLGDALFALQASGEAHTIAAEAVEGLSVRARALIADQFAAIATILRDAAACPDPWVGPDPTLDPLWRDPQRRSVAAVRTERRDIAVRAAALDLSVRLGMPELMIRERAANVDTLRERCPKVWAAFRAGGVPEQNAVTTARFAATLPDDHGSWARFDEALEHSARALVPGRFRVRARVVRERVHPEHVDDRHGRAAAERRTWLTAEPDGMATYSIFGAAAALHRIDRHVDAQARHLHSQPGEERTLAQLRADIAADLLLDGDDETAGIRAKNMDAAAPGVSNAHGAGPVTATAATACTACGRQAPAASTSRRRRDRVSIAITVPVMTLLGHSDEPATLHGYGPIDTETARQLAGEASGWVRILTHPVTGTVLDVDRTTYRVPKALRRWLGVRDPVCIAPGCMRLAHDCDIDHRLDWQYGGATVDTNLAPLCERHHVVKTKSKLRLYRDDVTGARWWVTATSLTVPVEPAPF